MLAQPLQERRDAPGKATTIQIKPQFQWPTLGDADYDVDAFLEEFEETTGLANDGRGMAAKEM
eukprot:3890639-Lingulodinium_polyedra.AAC.1